MIFEQLRAGGDRNFTYLIADEASGEAAVIDPGFAVDDILGLLDRHGLTLKYVINTHDHIDHTLGNAKMRIQTGAQIAMHENSRSYRDVELRDGDTLMLGEVPLRIIHTPGHTADGICIHAGNELVTGDTLFVGKVGGTGFSHDAREEYDSLHDKLMILPPETRVWPGHDYGVRPTSTIGDELRENPFLLRDSFDSFVELKKNWLAYKKEHGIA